MLGGYAKSTAVGKLIDLGGDTFWERTRNHDDMHERIQKSMPHLKPLGFDLEDAILHHTAAALQSAFRECGLCARIVGTNSQQCSPER
ncbi:hypothetical protein EU803_15545 [Loktanella sp. IMCC34160]|nr:hypothetical protein EU803_15545 [Loktanella sp. IMCC34160]